MDSASAFHVATPELPNDPRVRQLALTILTNRAVAQMRERELVELLDEGSGYLATDLVASGMSEVAAQLLLTEHLLADGWQFRNILRSVWYREEALVGVVQK